MRIEIDDEHAARLARLADGAGMSSARWVRGAVLAAEADPLLAAKIAEMAPASAHGGTRRGAGRPRRPEGGDAADPRQGA
ncbi:hypothetical protein [Glutamicibacter endophyticus]|uniref:hypothetical protein n=1 Tax=Glutamicibacter endophyticus TaxID=1522174 RepID=UPI003AF1B753